MKQPTYHVGASGKVVRDFSEFRALELLDWIRENEGKPETYTKLEVASMNFAKEKLETLKRKIKHQTSRKDLKDFKPDAVKKRQVENLRPTVLELLSMLRSEMDRSRTVLEAATQKVASHTAPASLKGSEKTDQILEHQEIRKYLLNQDAKDRAAIVQKELKAGNATYLHACLTSPIPVLSDETLEKLRRGAAPPEALANEKAAQQYVKDTRKQCGELSGKCFEALRAAGFERNEVISEAEFFETFPAKTEYEAHLISKRIQRQESEQAARLREQEWESRNEGMNLNPTPPPTISH